MEIGKKYLVKIPSVMEILPASSVCVFEVTFSNVEYFVIDDTFIDVDGEEITLNYDTDSNQIDISYRVNGVSQSVTLNDSSTFFPVIFVGQLREVIETGVEQFYDDDWLSTLTYQSVNDIFVLYQLDHFRNVVTKSDNTFIDIIGGSYKEQIDIINPSILIQYDDVPNFNYVYIPSLKRYYFVNKVICVRANLYQIDLHVDVLYSFDEDIRVQSGFVTRNQNTYDQRLFDNRIPTSNVLNIDYIDVNSAYGTTNSAVNVTFNQSTFGYNWVLDALSSKIVATYVQLQPPTNASNLPVIASNKVDTNILYAMNGTNAISFSKAIFKNSALASYVNSFILFPFDVTTITTYIADNISVNDLYLDYSDNTFKTSPSSYATSRKLLSSSIGYVVVADFTYNPTTTSYLKFLQYEPYSHYELFVAFVGWVTIKSTDFIGKRIIVYYGVDVSTGFATAYIRNYTDGKTIFSGSCQLGIKLPINTSNAEELIRQKQNNVLNMNLGLISSGVAVGIGAITSNPVAMVGGVLSGAKNIASIVNSENMMFERAQTTYTSTETSYYEVINKVWLKVSSHPVLPYTNIFDTLQGHPLNRYTTLSVLTGYTEVGEMKYIPSNLGYITNNEIDEIETLARNGIIL